MSSHPTSLIPLESVSCDLCGSFRSTLYLRAPEIVGYFQERDYFDLRRCQECGLIYVSPRLSEKDIGHYYDSSTYYAHQFDGKQVSHKGRDEKWQTKRHEDRVAFDVLGNVIKKLHEALRMFNKSCNRWYKSRLAIQYFGYPASRIGMLASLIAVAEKIVLIIPLLRLRILSKDLKISCQVPTHR
ncbi:MAG: hypothetical protein HY587_08300 [Candidatus Omnitrophica bacterium]|nr:hypothetical protein [Candidatus Omnitrophota bacterium]